MYSPTSVCTRSVVSALSRYLRSLIGCFMTGRWQGDAEEAFLRVWEPPCWNVAAPSTSGTQTQEVGGRRLHSHLETNNMASHRCRRLIRLCQLCGAPWPPVYSAINTVLCYFIVYNRPPYHVNGRQPPSCRPLLPLAGGRHSNGGRFFLRARMLIGLQRERRSARPKPSQIFDIWAVKTRQLTLSWHFSAPHGHDAEGSALFCHRATFLPVTVMAPSRQERPPSYNSVPSNCC